MLTVLKLLLPYLALLLSGIVYPFAFLATLITAVLKRDSNRPYVYVSEANFSIGYSLDLTGNVVGKDLFNALLKKAGGHDFGTQGETISSVLGRNKALGTLTRAGKVLAGILNLIQFGHVEKAAGLPLPEYPAWRTKLDNWLNLKS